MANGLFLSLVLPIRAYLFFWVVPQVEADDIFKQLSEDFTPDDTFIFYLKSMVGMDHVQIGSHSRDSPSFDEVC